MGNNLKSIDVDIPVGLFTCVTGVSGSGKSTLINDTLYLSLSNKLNRNNHETAPHDEILGVNLFDKVIDVNQSPIGRTPRSNPATYTGLFTPIRDLFSKLPESRSRGYEVGQTVLYGKYSGTELKLDGNDYLIMRESDILAIV